MSESPLRKFFNEHGIDPIDNRHGFSEKEQSWYGWSHRAIYGFGVGSSVSVGDCAHKGATPESLIEQHIAFFGDVNPSEERNELLRAECQILPDRSGIRIMQAPMLVEILDNPNDIADAIDGACCQTTSVDINEGFHEVKCGRGEWTAKTLQDAKQMALDFAEGVA